MSTSVLKQILELAVEYDLTEMDYGGEYCFRFKRDQSAANQEGFLDALNEMNKLNQSATDEEILFNPNAGLGMK